MMNKEISVLILCLVSCFLLKAQVNIVPVKVGSYELVEVRGLDQQIANKINKKIVFHSVFDDEVDFSEDIYGILNQLKVKLADSNGYGISSISTKVNYNKSNIVSLLIYVTNNGAYSWTTPIYLNFSTESGEQIHLDDIVNKSGFNYIDNKIREETIKRKDEKIKTEAQNSTLSKDEISKIFDDYKTYYSYPSKFLYSDKGISFFIDYGFPNVAKSFEPNREYLFTYSDLLGYFIKDKYNYSNIDINSTYLNDNKKDGQIFGRSIIYEDVHLFKEINLGEGKATCKVCIDELGNIVSAELLDNSTSENLIPVGKAKAYLRAVYMTKYEPNFESTNAECSVMTKYFYSR